MIDIKKLEKTSLVRTFVRKARGSGFTDGDIMWILRELKKDYLIESRKPGLHPGLVVNILKEKVESMQVARRIVKETCDELGIKTEKV